MEAISEHDFEALFFNSYHYLVKTDVILFESLYELCFQEASYHMIYGKDLSL